MDTDAGQEAAVEARLAELAADLVPPAGGVELAALIACDSVRGTVALACWAAADAAAGDVEAQCWQVVALEGGAVIEDAVLLRESLALVAMAETLADHSDPELLEATAGELDAWAAARDGEDAAELAAAIAGAAGAMRALAGAVRAPAGGIAASPLELDRIGGLMRELERAWTSVDLRAQQWVQARAAAEDAGAGDEVHELWSLLARVKGGPLAAPVSTLLEQGREAGLALAADVSVG